MREEKFCNFAVVLVSVVCLGVIAFLALLLFVNSKCMLSIAWIHVMRALFHCCLGEPHPITIL